MFVVAPPPPFRRAPVLVRVFLTICLSMVLCSAINAQSVASNSIPLAGLITLEFLIGISLAFSYHTAYAAIHSAGKLIDMQVGFAAAAIFDPNTENSSGPTPQILTLALLFIFFTANIHHELLIGLSKLIKVFPPGIAFDWNSSWIKILGAHFTTGFIIASPVIIILWLVDITLAFISRSLPKTPVYFIGLPAKIAIGMITLSWFLQNASIPIYRIFSDSLNSWDMMFRI